MLKKASGSKKPTMLKSIIEPERVKHNSLSQIPHAMRGAGSSEGAQLHAVHDVFAEDWEGGEDQEDIVTGYMEVVRSAIEPVFAIRPEDIVRNRSWELTYTVPQSRIPDPASAAMPESIPIRNRRPECPRFDLILISFLVRSVPELAMARVEAREGRNSGCVRVLLSNPR